MAKFIWTTDGRLINVALIGQVKATDDVSRWIASDLKGEHLATLQEGFDPATDLAEIIPAAPGTTCLMVFRGFNDVWHKIYAVIGWRCSAVDVVEPVLIESRPGALLTAISMPDGGWCAPDDGIWDTLEAALDEARERQRQQAADEPPVNAVPF